MTEQIRAEVKEHLQLMSLRQSIHEREMDKMRDRLLQYAAYFDSYAEMYCFIKANTPTFQHFCSDMKDASAIFFTSQEKKQALKK
jgi:hypothetical protein